MVKKFKSQYTTIESIMKRIDEMILFELKRDFTKKEELEFVELKKRRNELDPEWYKKC